MDCMPADLVNRFDIINAIKETYCIGCDNYHGIRCRACNFDDAMIAIDSVPTFDLKTIRELTPQWISVKDRLPEKLNENNQVYLTEEVIGFDGESACIGQFKVYKYDGLWTFFDGEGFRGDITHWMPLPEAPKEG